MCTFHKKSLDSDGITIMRVFSGAGYQLKYLANIRIGFRRIFNCIDGKCFELMFSIYPTLPAKIAWGLENAPNQRIAGVCLVQLLKNKTRFLKSSIHLISGIFDGYSFHDYQVSHAKYLVTMGTLLLIIASNSRVGWVELSWRDSWMDRRLRWILSIISFSKRISFWTIGTNSSSWYPLIGDFSSIFGGSERSKSKN